MLFQGRTVNEPPALPVRLHPGAEKHLAPLVEETLSALPASLVASLQKRGLSFHLAPSFELGMAPWFASWGRTIDRHLQRIETAGVTKTLACYFPILRRVILGSAMTEEQGRASNQRVILHELGHAADHLLAGGHRSRLLNRRLGRSLDYALGAFLTRYNWTSHTRLSSDPDFTQAFWEEQALFLLNALDKERQAFEHMVSKPCELFCDLFASHFLNYCRPDFKIAIPQASPQTVESFRHQLAQTSSLDVWPGFQDVMRNYFPRSQAIFYDRLLPQALN
jgi:hypothetical protein